MSKPNSFRCFLIGEGTLPLQCAQILLDNQHEILGIIFSDSLVQQWAQEHGIPHFPATDSLVDILSQQPFDYLFSIVNPRILSPEVLRLPQQCTINYHDSPLPRYAGMAASSWALMHHETTHAISWHVVTPGIDEGDILKQVPVSIEPGETAFSLNTKCYETAIHAFESLVGDLESGSLNPQSQSLSDRTYFSRSKKPAFGIQFRWHRSAQDLDALVRALTFGVTPNHLGIPKILLQTAGDRQWYWVSQVQAVASHERREPGTITALDAQSIQVATADGDLIVRQLRTLQGKPVAIADITNRFHLTVGDVLPDLTPELAQRIDAFDAKLAAHEGFWVREWRHIPPLQLSPQVDGSQTAAFLPIPLPQGHQTPSNHLFTAGLLTLAQQSKTIHYGIGICPLSVRQMVGDLTDFFVTQVPYRVDFEPTHTLQHIQAQVDQHLTLIERRKTHTTDLLARYPSLADQAIEFPVHIRWVEHLEDWQSIQLTSGLELVIADDGQCGWCYDSAQFGGDRLTELQEQFLQHWTALQNTPDLTLEEALDNLRIQSGDASQRLTEEERHRILVEWNATQADYPQDACLHHLVEAQVAQTPEAIAVRFEDETLTYAELNRRANQLAHHLQSLGIQPEMAVGICIERSLDMIVGLLGIVKAGGAYVPLDPTYPQDRLAHILSDANLTVVVTQEKLQSILPGHSAEVICLDTGWDAIAQEPDTNPTSSVTARNLAYIIYTSGSTGKPKGVLIEHRGAVNTNVDINRRFGVHAGDRVLAVCSLNFDLSVYDIFGLLGIGGTVVLPKPSIAPDLQDWMTLMDRHQITVWNSAPPVMQMFTSYLLDHEGHLPATLKLVMLSGDWIPITLPDVIRKLKQGNDPVAVISLGGATEASIWSIFYPITEVGADWKSIPYGKPLANQKFHVLNDQLQPVPVGAVGELFIGGDGVARGYLNRPDLNETKFIPDPFSTQPGATLYRTGDLGRYMEDGNIEFLGRIDHQVKIRGFRVELGEIESVISQHGSLREVAILVREDQPGNQQIVAYIVPDRDQAPAVWRSLQLDPELYNATTDTSSSWATATDWVVDLRTYLQEKLPHYMVPAAFVVLPSLPLTPNGKLDRRALPAPDPSAYDAGETTDPPRTPFERLLAEIWSSVLGTASIGIHDNFFNLGGHSLIATQVVSQIRQSLAVELPLRTLFEAPTLAELTLVVLRHRLLQLSPEELAALGSEACPPCDSPACLDEIVLLPVEVRSPLEQHLLDWQALKASTDIDPFEIVRRNPDEPVRMSLAQQRLWIVDQLENLGATYNVPLALRLEGTLNREVLTNSFTEIIRRHEAVRTTFRSVDGMPLQIIHPAAPFTIPVVDLRAVPQAEKEAVVIQAVTEETHRLFSVATDLLIRAKLLHIEDDVHILVITLHHIVSDGWSSTVLLHELVALYNAFLNHQPSPLPELEVQYADFAIWQRQWLAESAQAKQLDYWKHQLAGIPPLLEFPSDRPRPPLCSYRGKTLAFYLSEDLTQRLNQLSKEAGATLFMTLLAGFAVLLGRYSGQEDVVIGSPIANRTSAKTEPLIGFFVNMLALRAQLHGNPSFLDLLSRVRQTSLDAYANQDISFEKVAEVLNLERNLSYHPIFQVLFVLQNMPHESLQFQGLHSSSMPVDVQTSKFDLSLYMEESEGGLKGLWEYSVDLFDDTTIQRLTRHFITVLEGCLADPHSSVTRVPLLPDAERQHLLHDWNQTEADYPQLCLHQMIAEQVERSPDAIAVQFEDKTSLTYRELDTLANQLAHRVQALGIRADHLVGIYVHRSAEMLVAMLAVLKAGGAYVPIDPNYPQDRIAYVLEDAQVSVVLTETALAPTLPDTSATVICLDEAIPTLGSYPTTTPETSVSPDNLAYVIYTSGSTGRPKGVQIIHQAVMNFLTSMCREPGVTAADTVLAVTTLSFDIAVLELFAPLCVGAKTVIVSRDVATDGKQLGAWLDRSNATILQATPASWRMLLDAGWVGQSHLKMLCGGEPLTRDLANQLLPKGGELWNLYGPTETTVWSAASQIYPSQDAVLVGPAIANTELYVLDEYQQPVPIGVAGELYIGGDGLARGYLNRPDLTAEKFIPHPFSDNPNARLYRTGDRVRYRANGRLEFLGRIDFQVKIRGFRIELGEIESILTQHPSVKQAVVAAQVDPNGLQRLVAYLIPDQETPNPSQLRPFLREKLPDYMVPSAFMVLKEFPLTPNGKVNRKALPIPEVVRQDEEGIVLPQNDLELKLVKIWEELLTISPIGTHDNFFDLGGNSLLAAQVVDRIQTDMNQTITLATLFQAPTVLQLAETMQSDAPSSPWRSLVPIQTSGHKAPIFLFEGVSIYKTLATHLGNDQPVYGLAIAVNDDDQSRPETIETLAASYLAEIKTVQPKGPYIFGGISWGGIVAYEAAQQAIAQGDTVALIVLFDTILPGAYCKLSLQERLGVHWKKLQQEGLHYVLQRWQRNWGDTKARMNQVYGKLLTKFGIRLSNRVNYFVRHDWLEQVVASYDVPAYHGPVLLCRATQRVDRDMVKMLPRLGWDNLIENMDIFDVPADHLDVIKPPHAEPLAIYMRDRLAAALNKLEESTPEAASTEAVFPSKTNESVV
jgi:amino acid adenylation domain-containing protein